MKKTIELRCVPVGDVFTLDGVEFIKLDEDQNTNASFVLAKKTYGRCRFATDDAKAPNNFVGSLIQRTILRWLATYPAIVKAMLPRSIDLTTMDGMTDYGAPGVISRILTIDEYRKYRQYITLTDEPYWLATGRGTKSSPGSESDRAYYIYSDGGINHGCVFVTPFASRPAFYFQSLTTVEVEDDTTSLPVEFSSEDEERIDVIYNSIHELVTVLLEDENMEWDMAIIGNLADVIMPALNRLSGRTIYWPSRTTTEDGKDIIERTFPYASDTAVKKAATPKIATVEIIKGSTTSAGFQQTIKVSERAFEGLKDILLCEEAMGFPHRTEEDSHDMLLALTHLTLEKFQMDGESMLLAPVSKRQLQLFSTFSWAKDVDVNLQTVIQVV